MALDYDPVANLRQYPMSMTKYGQNPYGGNLYRIVFADSRRQLVGGYFPEDGYEGYRWRPKYPHLEGKWILEGWDWEKLSRGEWDRTMIEPISGLLLFGPYPARGEYDFCYEFDAPPTSGIVDKLVGAREQSRYRSFEDVRGAHEKEYATERKETRDNIREEIRDSYSYCGGRALSSLTGVNRGTKTAPLLIAAEQTGFRRPRGPRKMIEGAGGISVSNTIFNPVHPGRS